MIQRRLSVFYCPYCYLFESKGGWGRTNLTYHIKSRHPEQYEDYLKMKIGEVRYFKGEPKPPQRYFQPTQVPSLVPPVVEQSPQPQAPQPQVPSPQESPQPQEPQPQQQTPVQTHLPSQPPPIVPTILEITVPSHVPSQEGLPHHDGYGEAYATTMTHGHENEDEIPSNDETPEQNMNMIGDVFMKEKIEQKVATGNPQQPSPQPSILALPIDQLKAVRDLFQTQQPQQQSTESTATPILFDWRTTDPLKWFEEFMKYYQLKPVFMKIQMDRARRLNQLPNTATLMADLKSMDSGQSALQSIQYIAQEYEAKVQELLQQRQEPTQPISQAGIPIVPQKTFTTNPYGIPIYTQQPSQMPTLLGQSEVEKQLWNRLNAQELELKQEREKSAQRERELQQQQIAKLEATILQMQQNQQNPQKNFEVEQMRMELKQAQEKYNLVTQELAKDRELRTQKELEDIRRSQPTIEELMARVETRITAEHDRVTARDIDQKIREAVSMKGGPTKEEVEIKRAENELAMKKTELEVEREKAGVYMDGLTNMVSSVGNALGSAMLKPQVPAGMPPQQETDRIDCPNCHESLFFPPNIYTGKCPRCNTNIELTPDGKATIFSPPQATTFIRPHPQQKSEYTPPKQYMPPIGKPMSPDEMPVSNPDNTLPDDAPDEEELGQ